MAYDRQFIKLDWIFNVNTTDEIALTGIHVTGPSTSFDAETALSELTPARMLTIQGRMATLLSNTNIKWGDYSHCTSIKVAAVGTDGHYLTDARMSEAASMQGDDANVLPQSSVVVSLRSGSVIGEANYGRMYLPHTRFELGSTWPYTTSAIQSAFATAAGTFLTNVSSDLNADITQVVAPAIMSSKGSGVTKFPTTLLIGRVTDTQRRRRNRIDESYATGSFTP